MDMKEMMRNVLNDEAIVEKFSKCETAAEMQMLLEGSGIHMTEEEMLEACCELLTTEVKNGELSVDELDQVVGGNGMNLKPNKALEEAMNLKKKLQAGEIEGIKEIKDINNINNINNTNNTNKTNKLYAMK